MRHMLKNRFILSCLILVAAVFFLRPYLNTPGRILPRRIQALETAQASSVESVVMLARALSDAKGYLGLTEADMDRLADALEPVEDLALELEQRLEDLDRDATELSPQAQEAFEALQQALAQLMIRASGAAGR